MTEAWKLANDFAESKCNMCHGRESFPLEHCCGRIKDAYLAGWAARGERDADVIWANRWEPPYTLENNLIQLIKGLDASDGSKASPSGEDATGSLTGGATQRLGSGGGTSLPSPSSLITAQDAVAEPLAKTIAKYETVGRSICKRCGNPWFFNCPDSFRCTTCGHIEAKLNGMPPVRSDQASAQDASNPSDAILRPAVDALAKVMIEKGLLPAETQNVCKDCNGRKFFDGNRMCSTCCGPGRTHPQQGVVND